jgi:hypothetical protein
MMTILDDPFEDSFASEEERKELKKLLDSLEEPQ